MTAVFGQGAGCGSVCESRRFWGCLVVAGRVSAQADPSDEEIILALKEVLAQGSRYAVLCAWRVRKMASCLEFRVEMTYIAKDAIAYRTRGKTTGIKLALRRLKLYRTSRFIERALF